MSTITVQDTQQSIISVQPIISTVVTAFPAGLKGDKGDDGVSANPDDFFQIANNFSELDTEQKKTTARENLGISLSQTIEITTSPQFFSACRAVSLVNGVLAYADSSTTNPVIGFTRNAVGIGDPVSVQNSGELDGFFNLTIGLPIYLSSEGTVTQTAPTTERLQTLGIALSSTKVLIQIQMPMYLATIVQNGYFNNDYVDTGYAQ